MGSGGRKVAKGKTRLFQGTEKRQSGAQHPQSPRRSEFWKKRKEGGELAQTATLPPAAVPKAPMDHSVHCSSGKLPGIQKLVLSGLSPGISTCRRKLTLLGG